VNGHLVWEALIAAEALEAKGISAEVINIHTIKPLKKQFLNLWLNKMYRYCQSNIIWRTQEY
jgi:transketolase C-terminal domain/subunit